MGLDEIEEWVISIGAAIVLAIAVAIFIFLIVAFPWFSVLIAVAYLIFMFATFIHTIFFEE